LYSQIGMGDVIGTGGEERQFDSTSSPRKREKGRPLADAALAACEDASADPILRTFIASYSVPCHSELHRVRARSPATNGTNGDRRMLAERRSVSSHSRNFYFVEKIAGTTAGHSPLCVGRRLPRAIEVRAFALDNRACYSPGAWLGPNPIQTARDRRTRRSIARQPVSHRLIGIAGR